MDAMAEKRDAALENMAEKRDAALETMAEKRDAALETMADAKEAAAEAIAKVKPRLRGVSHEYAFFVSLALGVLLIILAKGRRRARLRRDLRGQPLGPLRGQRALSPRELEAAVRAPLDAPPRPHDDLLPDRRHAHAVRGARHGAAARDGAPHRRLGRRPGRHDRRAGLDRFAEVDLGERLRRGRPDRRGRASRRSSPRPAWSPAS